MPVPCSLFIKTANGKIPASGTSIQVQAVEHTVTMPRSPQTGESTGIRVHGVLKVTKLIDDSSPSLYQALAEGEKFEEVRLVFSKYEGNSLQEYANITLGGARVSDGRLWVPNCLLKENSELGHMEDISFSYTSIDWKVGGAQYKDELVKEKQD